MPECGVSEVGYALASIVPALPNATRRQLTALLAQTIASPTPAKERAQRLGLVCELVASSDLPSVRTYERVRAERSSENWPAASTLIEHFGSWAMVLRLAIRLQFQGHHAPVRSSHRPLRHATRPYSRSEVLEGIQRVAEIVGRVPGLSEYAEIRRVLRRHAVLTGSEIPRLAGRGTIERLFESYREAAAIAIRENAKPPEASAPARRPSRAPSRSRRRRA